MKNTALILTLSILHSDDRPSAKYYHTMLGGGSGEVVVHATFGLRP